MLDTLPFARRGRTSDVSAIPTPMSTTPTDSLARLTRRVLAHRDKRQWGQFHTPKELAVSLCVEAAELLSLMQWKSGEELEKPSRPSAKR